ncbi:MAG: Asp-tRNA(Asn)/Glu-tRNA(Gln) amidotransferase subunit GatC, partial [bacterium]
DLARLEMTDDELDTFTSQLNSILEYASKLNELEMNDVEPTSHVVPLKNVFRDDEVKPSLHQDDLRGSCSPYFDGEFFEVPRVIEE